MADWPQGVGLIRLDSVDSTMDEARRRAAAGAEGPLWIHAGRQTGGRGRQGRAWVDPGDALAATLLFRPGLPPAGAALVSFAACLAVAEFFEGAGAAPALKWPNDALLNGRKAAGVLLETVAGAGGAPGWLAVGIGVNLAAAPPAEPGAAHPPTSLLAETGRRVAPADALAAIAPALARWSGVLVRDGFAPLRAAWLSRAARRGGTITARLPRETLRGVFEDVDLDGALVLRTPAGPRRIHAADIHFE